LAGRSHGADRRSGSPIAAFLWHQAKLVFNWYLTHYARHSLFYGILGGFIGLILWVFCTAIILLFEGLLANVLDRGGRPPKSQRQDPSEISTAKAG
jgi:uncharacterized BrkB/YihY/UPF0761 family membrane protein